MIWKALNVDYKAALTRFTVSGTHDNNFYNFCGGKLDVYYLRKQLELRPNLNDMVIADLPQEVALSSDDIMDERNTATTETDTDQLEKGKKGKRKRNENEIATAIRDFSHANMRSELAKQKLRFMEKEDQRQEKEDQRKEHRTLFDEWERLQSRLRTMRQDARDETLDKTTRQELEEDINGLVKRKNELATKLNLK